MNTLETNRLLIRPFTMEDLEDTHQLFDIALEDANMGDSGALSLDARREYLQWAVLNYRQLENLHQPPYGDRAVVLKEDGRLIGSVGYVPCLNAFGQLPLPGLIRAKGKHRYSTEFGLFYAISPTYQRQGFATEATQRLVQYAFEQLGLWRIVATTDYDNQASIAVMRKLGMNILRNPDPDPPWLQVVGFLENLR